MSCYVELRPARQHRYRVNCRDLHSAGGRQRQHRRRGHQGRLQCTDPLLHRGQHDRAASHARHRSSLRRVVVLMARLLLVQPLPAAARERVPGGQGVAGVDLVVLMLLL